MNFSCVASCQWTAGVAPGCDGLKETEFCFVFLFDSTTPTHLSVSAYLSLIPFQLSAEQRWNILFVFDTKPKVRMRVMFRLNTEEVASAAQRVIYQSPQPPPQKNSMWNFDPFLLLTFLVLQPELLLGLLAGEVNAAAELGAVQTLRHIMAAIFLEKSQELLTCALPWQRFQHLRKVYRVNNEMENKQTNTPECISGRKRTNIEQASYLRCLKWLSRSIYHNQIQTSWSF